jgi:replicative DNA helicase
MKEDIKQITQFYNAASQASDAQGIMDAAKSVFDQPDAYKEYIISHAKEKGISITGELAELLKATAGAQAQAQKEKEQARVKEILESLAKILEQYIKNLSEGHSPDEAEMREAAAEMEKVIARLTVLKEQDRIVTFDQYLADCQNYEPDKDFKPKLFAIPFPDGTVSYIGARTSRGKTTSMLNLAREAITANPARKVLFITLEMSTKQLITRLALSLIYAHGLANNTQESLKRRENPMKDYYSLMKGNPIDGGPQETDAMIEGYRAAMAILKSAFESKSFLLYDGRGASLDAIIDMIKVHAEKGTLVLIDYIQRMPSADGTMDSSYTRIKVISDRVWNTAVATGAVIIAGAQFNRVQDKDHSESKSRDTFDDTSFRESGDLEQDAHCAIGLGWYKNDHNKRFFEILKARECELPKHRTDLIWCGAFQYMNFGQPFAADITPTAQKVTTPTAQKGESIRRIMGRPGR